MMIRLATAALLVGVTSLRADPVEMTRTLIEGNVFSSAKEACPFRVEVRQVAIDKVAHPRPHYYGHYDDPKQYVCSEVSISLKNQTIKVPETAYSDLCYLQNVTPPESQENGTWIVSIVGGSGGESYEAQLVFDQVKLLERRLAYLVPERKRIEVRKF